MIIFSPSIRSGPANTAGSENSIPAEKPTKKISLRRRPGVGDREGKKGRGIGKRESSLPFSFSSSPSKLKKIGIEFPAGNSIPTQVFFLSSCISVA